MAALVVARDRYSPMPRTVAGLVCAGLLDDVYILDSGYPAWSISQKAADLKLNRLVQLGIQSSQYV